MKLQVVCQHYYPESFPLTRMCPLLAENGDTVRVLTGLPNYPEGKIYKGYHGFRNRRQRLDGVDIVRASLIPRGKSNIGLFLNYASFAFFGTLRALFLKKDFDAILVIQSSPVSMALPGMLLKRLTKKPLYIYTFDLWPESLVSGGVKPDSRIYNMVGKFSKWVYASADKIFVSSEGFREYFKDVHGIHENVHYLPFYETDMHLPEAEKSAKRTHLVFAGNIGHLQSVQTLVKAAKLLENTDVFISVAGDGSAKAECEKLTEELEVRNLVFLGKKPFSEMPALYASADALVLTLAKNDLIAHTLPNKLLGYMAAGKPIIVSADKEATRILTVAKCGYAAPAEDEAALAKAICDFIDDKDKSMLGKNARQYYESHFTTDIFLKTLKSLMAD